METPKVKELFEYYASENTTLPLQLAKLMNHRTDSNEPLSTNNYCMCCSQNPFYIRILQVKDKHFKGKHITRTTQTSSKSYNIISSKNRIRAII
jgi:uncharacterized protein YcaQ